MTKVNPSAGDVPRLEPPRAPLLGPDLLQPLPTIPESGETDLTARFSDFAEECSQFSKAILASHERLATASPADHVRLNLRIARTIFSKWAIDILALLYARRTQGFQDVKKALGRISSRVLSLKLTRLERLELVKRTVLDTRPPRVQYSLTHRGFQVARLGEPVILYLRLTEDSMAGDHPHK